MSPLAFTPEFRRKVAALPKHDRLEWLTHLAEKIEATPSGRARIELEAQLREVARACRHDMVQTIERQLGPFDPLHLRALLEVPRERYVRLPDIPRSSDDIPLPLDDIGQATISAPHAYLLSYRLLSLAGGDTLLELGTGTGYGAALASYIVGARGSVVTVEIDETLVTRAAMLLGAHDNVRVVSGDAMEAVRAFPSPKIAVTFAVEEIPNAWGQAIPEGGMLVAPVGAGEEQRLLRVRRERGELRGSDHGAVRYVKNRSGAK